MEQGKQEVDRALRLGHPLSAILVDIDYFKQVNDMYGHAVGDQVLQTLVNKFRENVRSIDKMGRYGGDEFVILLVENDLPVACQVAERLREAVERSRVITDHGEVCFTISLGVASLDEVTHDLPTLIERADQAMYDAKRLGRNRVSCRVLDRVAISSM